MVGMALSRVANGWIGRGEALGPTSSLPVPIFCHIQSRQVTKPYAFALCFSQAVRTGSAIPNAFWDHLTSENTRPRGDRMGILEDTVRPNMLRNGAEIEREMCDAESG